MPDTIGATIFDDLPESIIIQEIFLRLPSRDILRCGRVSKSWRGATSTNEFLLDHHQRQPSLPLVIFSHEDSIDALDIREAPAKRRPVLEYRLSDNGCVLSVQASCDGLLLVSLLDGRFNIVNPATRQWLAIPRLTGAYRKIAGMYPHPHRSGQYNILFERGEREERNAGYYVLTVGSYQNQKPKCVGPLLPIGIYTDEPPVPLNGCLHWVQNGSLKDGILIFDTVDEKFRSMSLPATAGGTRRLLQMEGTLGMISWLDDEGRIVEIWVLQDYEREIWSKFSCELPMVTYGSNVVLSHKKDMLIYYGKSCLHQLHYDSNGKILEDFKWEVEYPNITGHWFKESLIRHTFFPRRCSDHVTQPWFFRRL